MDLPGLLAGNASGVCPGTVSVDEHAAAAEGFFHRRELGCIVVQIGVES